MRTHHRIRARFTFICDTEEEADRIIQEYQKEGREAFTPEGERIHSARALLDAEEVIVPFRLMGG